MRSIISHNEQRPGRDTGRIEALVIRAPCYIRLIESPSVDEDPPVYTLDQVSGKTDDPLYEPPVLPARKSQRVADPAPEAATQGLGAREQERIPKDDQVTSLKDVDSPLHSRHEDSIARHQRRSHRR